MFNTFNQTAFQAPQIPLLFKADTVSFLLYFQDGFKVKAFLDLYIAIKGFDLAQSNSLELIAKSNGAEVVTPDDPRCTHLVLQSNYFSIFIRFAFNKLCLQQPNQQDSN